MLLVFDIRQELRWTGQFLRPCGSHIEVGGLGFRVKGFGFRVQGLGFQNILGLEGGGSLWSVEFGAFGAEIGAI